MELVGGSQSRNPSNNLPYRERTLANDDQGRVEEADGLSRSLKGLGLLCQAIDVGDHLLGRDCGERRDCKHGSSRGEESAKGNHGGGVWWCLVGVLLLMLLLEDADAL